MNYFPLKAMKKIYFIILFYLAIGCKNQKDYQELIKGDWHSEITEEFIDYGDGTIDTTYTYNEFAFTDAFVYTYLDIAGLVSPRKYHITKDSMFIYMEQDTVKDIINSGKIVFQNENQFKFISKLGTYSHFRIKETDKGLSNYVIPDSIQRINRFKYSIDSFHLIFRKRYNKKVTDYLQNKKQ